MKMRKVFRAGLFAGVSTLALALALVGVGRSCSRTPSDVGIQGSASAVVPGTASPAAEAPAENGQVKPTPVLARPRATPAPTEPQPAPFPAKRGDSGREGQALPALADILPLNPKLELAGIRAWYGVPGKAVAEGQSVPPTHRLKLKGYRIDRIELGADVKVSRDRTQAYGYRIRITGDELAPRAMPTFIWIGRHVLQYTRTGERSVAAIFFDAGPLQAGAHVGVSYGVQDPAEAEWFPPMEVKPALAADARRDGPHSDGKEGRETF